MDIGLTALSVEPEMEQVFIACPDHINNPDDFERKLFVLRNYAAQTINNTVRKDSIGFYVASLSYKTVIYKGQLNQLTASSIIFLISVTKKLFRPLA